MTTYPSTWHDSPLAESVARAAALMPFITVTMGEPEPDRAVHWLAPARLGRAEHSAPIVVRIAELRQATPAVARTYTFRYAIAGALRLCGYLFAHEGRVPALAGNILVADRDALTDIAVLRPIATVLAGDPLAGRPGITTVMDQAALTDALFRETAVFVHPLLTAAGPHRLVARANGWATVLDFLAYGFQMAGRDGPGLDAAWLAWERTLTGRRFPTRRRPRRFTYTVDGNADELLVRAGCCLYFTLPQARTPDQRYCTSCFIESDARRLDILTAHKRRLAREAEAATTTP